MPLDNAAAQNAQSLLNGIDYSALIGGPLQAAIKAQAMAARSTWEFIKEVGLKEGPDGDKEAVNVSFTYLQNGQLVKLNVPILVIVPIPLIEVTDLSIDFKATINASASQASEQSESSQMGGELGVQAKVGWGPFSINANFKASYSSKKDSKATQDSRYSVEYTQNVALRAGQAGVPAGLATILNILSSSVTGSSPDGDLSVSPALVTLDWNDPTGKQGFDLRVVNADARNCPNQEVVLTFPKDQAPAFSLATGIMGKPVAIDADGVAKVTTNAQGKAALLLSIEPTHVHLLVGKSPLAVTLQTDTGKGQKKTAELAIEILGTPSSASPKLIAQPSKVKMKAQSAQQARTELITLTPAGEEIKATVNIVVSAALASGVGLKGNGQSIQLTDGKGCADTDENGVLALEIAVADPSKVKSGPIELSSDIGGTQVSTKVDVTVTQP